jgi:arginyl-tRNA--protein-N-Asp/Glu arginylyltransferase
MADYLAWDKIVEPNLSPTEITQKYNNGFVFTRESKGSMYKTRSLRINLREFTPSSENRRILTKTEGMKLEYFKLPLDNYDWQIHKLGKDYYETKFGPGIFSANKIKELLTGEANFTALLEYRLGDELVGYAICYDNEEIRHYAYPFYDLNKFANNFGMGMMLNAIIDAQDSGKQYIYLGSASRPGDAYKLQFSALEWFDGALWQTNTDNLKNILSAL